MDNCESPNGHNYVPAKKKFNDNKIKYLEMIQAIISRMAANSFLLKGWTITLITAFFALPSNNRNYKFFVIYLPVVSFWLLDSYYLRMERRYRKLYEKTLDIEPEDITFDLQPYKLVEDCKNTNYWFCLFSSVGALFYITTVIVVTIIIFFN